MEAKDLWLLLAGVENDIAGVIKNAPPEVANELQAANIILIEKTNTVIDQDGKVRIFYDGKEMEPPKFFWPAMTNTDSYSFENILIESGAACILNLNDVAAAHSKAISYARLSRNGIRIPKSLVFYHKADRKRITDTFAYPFVVKPDTGTGGAGVALIRTEAELDAYMDQLVNGATYIAQEYISTSKGRDLRVVMLGGEKLYAMARTASNPDEFRSNVHVGGTMREVDIDGETVALCKKIAGLYDLDLIGLDLLFGEDGFVVTEVNNFPGIIGPFVPYLKPAGLHVIGSFIEKKRKAAKGAQVEK